LTSVLLFGFSGYVFTSGITAPHFYSILYLFINRPFYGFKTFIKMKKISLKFAELNAFATAINATVGTDFATTLTNINKAWKDGVDDGSGTLVAISDADKTKVLTDSFGARYDGTDFILNFVEEVSAPVSGGIDAKLAKLMERFNPFTYTSANGADIQTVILPQGTLKAVGAEGAEFTLPLVSTDTKVCITSLQRNMQSYVGKAGDEYRVNLIGKYENFDDFSAYTNTGLMSTGWQAPIFAAHKNDEGKFEFDSETRTLNIEKNPIFATCVTEARRAFKTGYYSQDAKHIAHAKTIDTSLVFMADDVNGATDKDGKIKKVETIELLHVGGAEKSTTFIRLNKVLSGTAAKAFENAINGRLAAARELANEQGLMAGRAANSDMYTAEKVRLAEANLAASKVTKGALMELAREIKEEEGCSLVDAIAIAKTIIG
jgi:hypothetical protein